MRLAGNRHASPANLYPYDTLLEFTAVPVTGSYFVGWSGDAVESTNPLRRTVTGAIHLMATFAAVPAAVPPGQEPAARLFLPALHMP